MAQYPAHFAWWVPRGGFDVDATEAHRAPTEAAAKGNAGEPPAQRVLRPRAAAGGDLREYDAFKDSTLYLRFADLLVPLSKGDATRFADAYGPLTVKWLNASEPYRVGSVDEERFFRIEGEELSLWEDELRAMQFALEGWETVRAGRTQGRHSVENTISARLRGRTDVLFELDADPPTLIIRPWDLIGAMWLQFARHVEIGADYKPCAVCEHPFEVLPHDARTLRREYCSDACRQRALVARRGE